MSSLRGTLTFLALIAIFASCSCGGKPADEAVRRDFERYEKQLLRVSHLEAEGAGANKRAAEDPKGNDASYARALKAEIIPAFKGYEQALETIRPVTNELIGLHEILKERIKKVHAGFVELERAGRTGNKEALEKAQALFAEGRLLYRRWSGMMDELHKTYPPEK